MADGRKVFEFGAKKALAKSEPIGEFELLGEVYYIRALKDSATAILIHQTRSSENSVVLSAILNFTEKALVPESATRFAKVCLDPIDGLDMDQILEVFKYVLSIVAANPTGSSSDSSPTVRKSGTRSTAASRAKASTL